VLVAVLNPHTHAETERMRRWLERPGGSLEEDESFFGTLTSLFVAGRVPDADARLEVHSQEVPAP
jgi:hypothetical protein